MGKQEILILVASIIMFILLGYTVGPSIIKSTDIPKYAVYNTEISTIRNVAILWIADNNADGTSTGITTDALASYSRLTKNTLGYLESKINSSSGYTIVSPDSHHLEITIHGIILPGAEAYIRTVQSKIAISTVDIDPNDGILVFTYNL